MKKKKKVIIIVSASVVGVLAIASLAGLMYAGYMWGMAPFGGLRDSRIAGLPGNAEKYSADNVERLEEDTPLTGKKILYLGSSVTYGYSSQQTSFVEYIDKRNGSESVKEAVNGTTLVDDSDTSYIHRLEGLDTSAKYDLFVCQLSTNDASQNKTLGEIGGKGATHDMHTIVGAIEHIIEYVTDTWDCPVAFFTNSYYENENYAAMVDSLAEVQTAYGIGVIDLYRDDEFNAITAEQRSLYMEDSIHPTKAGYLEWWTPEMEEYLYAFIGA